MTGAALAEPQVSICLAAYNAESYLEETLRSLQAQTFTNFEVVAVDDGSQDATLTVLRSFARDDSRIRVFWNDTNRGLVFTRNRCIEESRGAYLAIADSDDISESRRLEQQLKFFSDHPNVGAVGSDVSLIDARGNQIGSIQQEHREAAQIRFFLMLGPQVHNAASMYRRDAVLAVGGYSDGFDEGAEDYHLWGKLAKLTDFANLQEPLVRYRKHSASVTSDRRGVDQNIFRISASLLSEYLAVEVTPVDAARLHGLLTFAGMEPHECQVALRLGKVLWAKARAVENTETVTQFGARLANASWRQAQYQVYADRAVSTELALMGIQLSAQISTFEAAVYARRWLTPRLLRRGPKSGR